MTSRTKQSMRPLTIFFVWMVVAIALSTCATLERTKIPEIVTPHGRTASLVSAGARLNSPLKVMTLNVAHGRSTGFHQLLQSRSTTLQNLDQIRDVLKRERPHLLALQEADGPSFWSGNFNHVEYLAEKQFHYQVRGEHADRMNLSYGTALLSNLKLDDPLAITFAPAVASSPKGFVVATIDWPGYRTIEVDVVSVHLAALRKSLRKEQATELAKTLSARGKPTIILGDLNAEWTGGRSALHLLMDALSLKTYRPYDNNLVTFPKFNERLDWILVSPEFEFVSHEVLPDPISDHRGVVAEVVLTPPPSRSPYGVTRAALQ
ncbi:MAG: hypothetical protein GTO40_31120 [Deltaproteobacteria bacterium]|nr:hypothetical protein [Deltaproteobacteria bacterium]